MEWIAGDLAQPTLRGALGSGPKGNDRFTLLPLEPLLHEGADDPAL